MAVMPGCAAVEMVPRKEKFGSLYLPDELSTKTKPDCGWVVGAGEGVPLSVGDRVVVRYGTGKRVKGFSCKGFSADYMVFTGWAGGSMVDDVYGDPIAFPFRTDWDDVIMAKFEGNEVVPAGKNVMLELTEVTKEGSVLVSTKRWECDARIIGMGKDAGKGEYSHLAVGRTALFYDGLLTFIGPNVAIVPQEGIMAVYD